MKVDFHFHLEEGPYTFNWLQRTSQALLNTSKQGQVFQARTHTLDWMGKIVEQLDSRLKSGCYAQDWITRYLQKGRERGIERFGLVDHLYRFTEFKAYYEQFIIMDDSSLGKLQKYWLDKVCTFSIEEYLHAVREAAENDEKLSIGVEADYFVGGEQQLGELLSGYQLDYVIGSVHFLDGWGFDNPETVYRFHSADVMNLYEKKFQTVKQAIASGLFDFIAHLDNLKVFGFRPDENSLIPWYKQVASSLRETGMGTEINTGLLYRYPVKEMCPSPSFLQILFEHQVPITLSSDAHFPDDIGMHLEEAALLAQKTGYQEIFYYKKRQRHMVPIR